MSSSALKARSRNSVDPLCLFEPLEIWYYFSINVIHPQTLNDTHLNSSYYSWCCLVWVRIQWYSSETMLLAYSWYYPLVYPVFSSTVTYCKLSKKQNQISHIVPSHFFVMEIPYPLLLLFTLAYILLT